MVEVKIKETQKRSAFLAQTLVGGRVMADQTQGLITNVLLITHVNPWGRKLWFEMQPFT